MYGNNYYGGSSSFLDSMGALMVGMIVCLILAVIGGIVLHFVFLSKKNENKFTGFVGWLYDFLSFKKLLLETVLKIIYLIAAVFITLFSLVTLFAGPGNFGANFLSFLLTLSLGNVAIRIAYEFMLLLILICKNTSDISKKLGASKEEAPPVQQYQETYVQPQQQQYTQYQQSQYQQPQQQQGVVFCQSCGNQFNASEANCPHCGNQRF